MVDILGLNDLVGEEEQISAGKALIYHPSEHVCRRLVVSQLMPLHDLAAKLTENKHVRASPRVLI